MKIAGYKKVEFTADDNVEISGYSVYFFDDFDNQTNYLERGCFFEKAFLNKKKFDEMNIHNLFEEQKDVIILYNRYGKIEKLI